MARLAVLDRSSRSAVTVLRVRAIRRFTVRPVLPAPLEALGRAGRQPALVLAPRDPGPLRRRRRPALGGLAGTTRCGCSAPYPSASATSWPPDKDFLTRLAAVARRPGAVPDRRPLVPAARLGRDAAPASIGYFSPEFGITAVLPQYSGGLGILAGDHLKTASDLGVPIIGVGLLYRHGYFRQSLSRDGWQQETYPVLDPDGLPLSLLREAGRLGRQDRDRPARDGRRAVADRPDLGRPGRPGAAAAARLRRRGEQRGHPRRHRPAVRRQHRAPAAPGDAARHRRRARDPRLLPDHRRHRPPRSSTPTRATPASSASSGSASSPRTSGAQLRRGPRGLPRRHGVHHAHAGPGRHRPVPARPGRAVLRRRQRLPRRPGRPDPRARRRGLRGRRPGDVQHGGDGLPARAARQRRLAAARRGQPRACSAGSGRSSTPTSARSPRSPTACTRRPGWPARSSTWPAAHGVRPGPDPDADSPDLVFDVVDKVPGKEIWDDQAGAPPAARRRRPARGCASPGGSAAPRRPS